MKTLTASVKTLFQGLKWYEKTEYLLLALFVITIATDWSLALWCLLLLCANTIVKIFASHHIGNPSLNRPIRICLCLMAAYYMAYAVSALYSSQPHEALSTLSMMLPLLLFPLIFLLSDTRYLRRPHLSFLTYLFAATLTLRFLVMLVRASIHSAESQLIHSTTDIITALLLQFGSALSQSSPFQNLNTLLVIPPFRAIAHLFNGTPFEALKPFEFDPLHHNYLSLYLLTAIALLYTELLRHWKSPRWRKIRWIVIADIAMLSIHMLLSDSRSGIVVWIVLASACLVHLAFVRKQWRSIAIILASLAVLVGGSYWASPKSYERISSTLHNIRIGEQADVRQDLWKSGLATAREHPVFGYGCDGYWDSLFEQYRTHDCFTACVNEFSTHNQYIETLLATGIVGLVLLLAMILLPVYVALRRRPHNLPLALFTVVYAPCLIFEATFGRQMGLLFIGFWYCLLLLHSRSISTSSQLTLPEL